MFPYDPDEAERAWPDGTYRALIVTANEKTSKTGKPMLEVTLEASRGSEALRLVDRFVSPGSIWKVRMLAEALGAKTEFRTGTFDAARFVGRPLDIDIVTTDDPNYGKGNRIVRYLAPSLNSAEPDHEVPF